jgi:hypothetical protein
MLSSGRAAETDLSHHVGRDQQAEQQDERDGDEQLRGKAGRTVVVDVRAGRPACRAAPLDDRATALCTDQVLAAHLVPLPSRWPGALAVIWSLSRQFPPRLFPGLTRLPASCPARPEIPPAWRQPDCRLASPSVEIEVMVP